MGEQLLETGNTIIAIAVFAFSTTITGVIGYFTARQQQQAKLHELSERLAIVEAELNKVTNPAIREAQSEVEKVRRDFDRLYGALRRRTD